MLHFATVLSRFSFWKVTKMLAIAEYPPSGASTLSMERSEIDVDQLEPLFTANAWRDGAQITTGLYLTLDEAQDAVQNLVADGWTVLISTVTGLPVMMSAE